MKEVERIVQRFKIDTTRTRKIKLPSLSESTRLYEVDGFAHRAHIISTPAARDIACYPSIVGDELDAKNLELAVDAAKAMFALTTLGLKDRRVILAHVLRAGPGYKIAYSLRKLNLTFCEIFIRPRYKEPSYRAHDGSIARELEIIYEDFSALDSISGEKAVLLKPDTEASGRTGEISIRRIFEECRRREIEINEVILYGFISEPGLRFLEKVVTEYEATLSSFAIACITSLAHNKYDMPLYGNDESYFTLFGKIRELGSITDVEILHDYLPHYFPGMDLPGDFSARQSRLWTGDGFESGDVKGHILNSLNLLHRLERVSNRQDWYRPWHAKIAEMHFKLLERKLAKYAQNP